MSNFVGKPPLSNSLWDAIETIHFNIAHTKFFWDTFVSLSGVPMNNLAPMKNCPGVQGNLNWILGYYHVVFNIIRFRLLYIHFLIGLHVLASHMMCGCECVWEGGGVNTT